MLGGFLVKRMVKSRCPTRILLIENDSKGVMECVVSDSCVLCDSNMINESNNVYWKLFFVVTHDLKGVDMKGAKVMIDE